MLRRIAWLVAVALVLGGAVYLEFVLDIRTPRSPLQIRAALVTHNKLPPETLAAVAVKLKAKFGEDATVWQGPTGIYVRRDGDILAIEPAETFFHEALGITRIADEAGKIATFPFHVSPYELRENVHPALVPSLKMRVATVLPAGSDDFERDDFSIEQCRSRSAPALGLGFVGGMLGLSNSTTCTVVWKREPSRRMLIGIVVADGGNWIRPFVRSACRMLSNAWLERAEDKPDYLQCLLIDRRENRPFGSGVSAFAYEVRKDGSLARFVSSPVALEEVPLGPDPRVPTRAQREAPQRQTEVVPLKPDSRVPTFHRVEPSEPPPTPEPERRSDPAHEALASSLIEAADRLSGEPCDEAAKARYIEAAVTYSNAWLKLLPCFEKNNCSYEDNLHNEEIKKTAGWPWRSDVTEAARNAHQVVAFRESDFPKKVVLFMASIAADPAINPEADPAFRDSPIREMMRRERLPDGCPAADRQ